MLWRHLLKLEPSQVRLEIEPHDLLVTAGCLGASLEIDHCLQPAIKELRDALPLGDDSLTAELVAVQRFELIGDFFACLTIDHLAAALAVHKAQINCGAPLRITAAAMPLKRSSVCTLDSRGFAGLTGFFGTVTGCMSGTTGCAAAQRSSGARPAASPRHTSSTSQAAIFAQGGAAWRVPAGGGVLLLCAGRHESPP